MRSGGWTAAQGLLPPLRLRPRRRFRTRASLDRNRRCPPRDPALLTAAAGSTPGGFGAARRQGSTLPRRGVALGRRLAAGPRLRAGERAAGGPCVGRLQCRTAQGLRAVHRARLGAVRRDGGRSRRLAGGLVRWLVGAGHRPRPDCPKVPGAARLQAGAWAWASRLRAAVGGARRRRLRLACDCRVGRPRLSPPWAPRGSRRWRRACGAAPGSSSPSTRTTLDLRPRSGLRACLDAGPPPSPFPRASATWPSLRPFPTAAPSSSACWLRRLAPPASGFFPASHSPDHFPLYRSLARSGLACGTPSRSTPSPLSPPRRTYAQFTTGLACLPAPRTGFSLEARTGHSLQEVSTSQEGDTK